MKKMGKENIKKVLEFLSFIENPGNNIHDKDAEPTISGPCYSSQVDDFIRCLYQQDVIQPFDWAEWQDEAQEYVANPSLLDRADLLTIQKLFTLHVRKDRFSGGHFGCMIEQGHILLLLKRLKRILNHLE